MYNCSIFFFSFYLIFHSFINLYSDPVFYAKIILTFIQLVNYLDNTLRFDKYDNLDLSCQILHVLTNIYTLGQTLIKTMILIWIFSSRNSKKKNFDSSISTYISESHVRLIIDYWLTFLLCIWLENVEWYFKIMQLVFQ